MGWPVQIVESGDANARIDGKPAGTAAFRPLSESACEAKRLYVRTAFRRQGMAGALLTKLIEEARRCGYKDLYGDTLPCQILTALSPLQTPDGSKRYPKTGGPLVPDNCVRKLKL